MRGIALIFLFLLTAKSFGQDYPAREIRSVCNFAPGSGADIVVRYYSDALARKTFRYSIVYLAALFAALLVDHYL
jgi:tripartite-type tricarboxylate transporter receptor subunit TctC